MKLLCFNLMLFAIVFSTVSQKKSVFIKTIKTNNITNLDFNIDRQHVKIIPSKDNDIHINFVMENRAESISSQEFDEVYKMYSSIHKISDKTLKFDFIRKLSEKHSKIFKDDFKDLSYKYTAIEKHAARTCHEIPSYLNSRLTKKQLLKYAIRKSGFNKFHSDLEKRVHPKSQRLSVLYERAFYEIQVPEQLINKMMVFTRYGNFETSFEVVKDLDLVAISSKYIKFNKILNSKFQCSSGKLIIGECDNVDLMFTSSAKSFFGKVNNSNISLDDSRIFIAEVGENSRVMDAGGEIFLYDFSNKFKDFKFNGDNSKIHFFQPKQKDYTLDCFGYDTFLYCYDIVIRTPKDIKQKDSLNLGADENIPFSKRKGVTKMFSRSRRNDNPYAGKLVFNITNSKFYMK